MLPILLLPEMPEIATPSHPSIEQTSQARRFVPIAPSVRKASESTVVQTLELTTSGTTLIAQAISPGNDGTRTQVTQQGNRFDITGGSRSSDGANLFQSFERFELNASQTANFLANPQIRNILGRVTGGQASLIDGLIQVTGGNPNLYLVNPAGIIFGANARLNVPASFAATTANQVGFGCANVGCQVWFNTTGTNDYASLLGTPNGFAFTTLQPGAVVNAGNLAVGQGQSLTLLGGAVVNTGTLSAPGGTVTVAAVPGENLVRVSQEGQLLSLEIQPLSVRTTPPETVAIAGLSLPELLTGGSVRSATIATVENGVVKLVSSGIEIPNEPGTAVISNQVDVAGTMGGNVNVLGKTVGVIGATINASGTNGGGTVRIGGDYKGQGNVPNAQQTFVSRDSVITADALKQGDGGRVIIWSDGTTRFYGNISTRGGSASGDGGFTEVSGKRNLVFQGTTNASSPNGKSGVLLLDPTNIVIKSGSADGDDSGASPNAFGNNPDGNNGQVLLGDSVPTVLYESELENSMNANLILQASNNITIEDLVDSVLELRSNNSINAPTKRIEFKAGGNFKMNQDDTIRAESVKIEAANITAGNISTSEGTAPGVILSATGNITVNTIQAFSEANSQNVIQIDAGGTFRAVGFSDTPVGNSGTIKLTEDPELVEFLRSQGVPETQLNPETEIRISPTVRTSIRVNPAPMAALSVRIHIRHGGEAVPGTPVDVQGRGGLFQFVSGGKVTSGESALPKFSVSRGSLADINAPGFELSDYRGNSPGFTLPDGRSFRTFNPGSFRTLRPDEFPEGVSGAVGTIAVVGSNYSVYASSQVKPFIPPPLSPTPVPQPQQPLQPQQPKPTNAQTQIVQREFSKSALSSPCTASTTGPSASSITGVQSALNRSSTAPAVFPSPVTTPCAATTSDERILKIIDDAPTPGQEKRVNQSQQMPSPQPIKQ